MTTQFEQLDNFCDATKYFETHIRILMINYIRYEKLRKLNPRQFHELWKKCNDTGQRFDDAVDKLEV
jgi:hypothetical protein